MMNRVDEKGKVFTSRVRKAEVEVNIVTTQGPMRGYVHLQPGQRVRDLMNNPAEQFLAITRVTTGARPGGAGSEPEVEVNPLPPDAGITAVSTANEIEFMALNKQYIISVVPVDEEKVERRRDEEYYLPR